MSETAAKKKGVQRQSFGLFYKSELCDRLQSAVAKSLMSVRVIDMITALVFCFQDVQNSYSPGALSPRHHCTRHC
jgi:hypothetical protein